MLQLVRKHPQRLCERFKWDQAVTTGRHALTADQVSSALS